MVESPDFSGPSDLMYTVRSTQERTEVFLEAAKRTGNPGYALLAILSAVLDATKKANPNIIQSKEDPFTTNHFQKETDQIADLIAKSLQAQIS